MKAAVEKPAAGSITAKGDYGQYCFDCIYEHGGYPR